jgi:hypothetical protein
MSDTPTPVAPDPIADLQAIAKAAAKQRLSAPVSGGAGDARIPQKDILARLNKQQGGADVKGGMHRLFVPMTALTAYAHKGYRPCKENGQLVTYDTDAAVEIETKIYENVLSANTAEDGRRWQSKKAEATALAAESGIPEEASIKEGVVTVSSKK